MTGHELSDIRGRPREKNPCLMHLWSMIAPLVSQEVGEIVLGRSFGADSYDWGDGACGSSQGPTSFYDTTLM